ncbi:hypothetical protein CPJCM30710_16380 [Clostridium polyendosporum]|uniref:DUF4446 family protein n=1 Tax=Clostridium polyendosporum TaxID=69208 RepID=A0A919RZ88_9CLOT|nr:DUF4446 family protein [Clostridium polyendosporum]GIM28972.1 hypothetical protein CPJCM30710_16380 [Clostridium polyendosporum]
MELLLNLVNDFAPYILIGLIIIIFLLSIIIIVLFKALGKVEKRYRKLMRGVSTKNLEHIVTSYLDKIDECNRKSEHALKEYIKLDDKIKSCTQKIVMMRYKAFEDIGSDLSFSMAILDGDNDGVVLTGLYARSGSTTYAKPIDNGTSKYDLSEEEITVLNKAINQNVEIYNN